MALEYVQISFEVERRVFIDGVDRGRTGDILRVDTGTHQFHLGLPFDYEPIAIGRLISGTNSLEPALIDFFPR